MDYKADIRHFEPEIVVLYCQYCLAKNVEVKSQQDVGSRFKAKFFMMPCSSKVEAAHVLKLLAEGADGVQVVGCLEEKCRFLVGNVMVEKRIELARHFLEEIRMGADRLGMVRGADLSCAELLGLAEHRADAVMELGPTPMKEAKII